MTTLSVIGKKYGKLTIIAYAYTKNKKKFWKCLCDCGKEPVINLNNIRQGLVRSCGCLRTHKYNPGESGLRILFSDYKTSARKEGRVFDLTLEDFKSITSKSCTYCGSKPFMISTSEHTKKPETKDYAAYKYNGIDRIDSNRGYEKDNIVPCCRWCNIIKRERTVEEFKIHVIKIYNHLKRAN